MKKADRQKVFDKYGGKCAYCGCELINGWHVDHIEPIGRKYKREEDCWRHTETKKKILCTDYKTFHALSDEERRKWKFKHGELVPAGCEFPERDVIENMLPACASCNINKHGDTIEGFRESIAGYLRSLNLRMVQYKMVKKYGLVEETNKPVIFYFETFNPSP